MVILIAPDKFKGSLSAEEVCEAIRQGLLSKNPEIAIETLPLADGGEGTVEVLTKNSGGSLIQKTVTGPLFSPVNAAYGISGGGETAFIEMAKASGLQLLKADVRNPLQTTTLGTGELIVDALNRRVRKIILGIGGSATNDAGIGWHLLWVLNFSTRMRTRSLLQAKVFHHSII
jgi:glycerate 2-kinase